MNPISNEEINIPVDLPFGEQLQRHSNLLNRLSTAIIEIEREKEEAKKLNSLPKYLEAEEEYENVKKVLASYSIGRAKSNDLISKGYRLNNIEPKICKDTQDCIDIDAITAIFFFDESRGLGGELKKKTTEANENRHTNVTVTVNDFNLTAFIQFLSDKPLDHATFGILPAIRDALIPIDDTGEIALWIRDPGKRTLDIVQNIRDGVLNTIGIGGKNNDIGKFIKDPINCSLGKLFGRCT